jgi:hypothetical protein
MRMTADRLRIRSLVALVLITIALAACTSPSGGTAPASGAPATGAPVTAAPSAPAPASSGYSY